MIRQGKAIAADGSTEGYALPAALFGKWLVHGAIWSSWLWRGMERLASAIAADGSTEHFGVPCCSLRRVDAAGHASVRQGRVRSGAARLLLQTAALRASALSAALKRLWSGPARRGRAFCGWARRVVIWPGTESASLEALFNCRLTLYYAS